MYGLEQEVHDNIRFVVGPRLSIATGEVEVGVKVLFPVITGS